MLAGTSPGGDDLGMLSNRKSDGPAKDRKPAPRNKRDAGAKSSKHTDKAPEQTPEEKGVESANDTMRKFLERSED